MHQTKYWHCVEEGEKSSLTIFVRDCRVYYEAHHGWARRKNFQNKSSQKAENANLIIFFADTVTFAYMVF